MDPADFSEEDSSDDEMMSDEAIDREEAVIPRILFMPYTREPEGFAEIPTFDLHGYHLVSNIRTSRYDAYAIQHFLFSCFSVAYEHREFHTTPYIDPEIHPFEHINLPPKRITYYYFVVTEQYNKEYRSPSTTNQGWKIIIGTWYGVENRRILGNIEDDDIISKCFIIKISGGYVIPLDKGDFTILNGIRFLKYKDVSTLCNLAKKPEDDPFAPP